MSVTNTVPPAISGTAQRGQTLTTTNGSWTFSLDHLTYAYQWERCDAGGGSCVAIPGATSNVYLLTLSDVGSTIRSKVTATEHASSGQPTPTFYFDEDFTDISRPPWNSVQTYYPPGYGSPTPGQQGDPSGRLQIVTAPDAVGKAIKFEIRDSDPGWPPDTTVDRSQLEAQVSATWNQPSLVVGDERWFQMGIWLPNEFDYPRTNWFTMIGIHPGANTWGCFDLGFDNQANHPAYLKFKVAGGSPIGSTANLQYINLIQLTNSDGTIYAPNRNRRIDLLYGGKFNPDNTGWLEIWLDGVNIFPRTSRPTMWAGDTSSYFKVGPYKSASSPFPSGKTIVYFTQISIGTV